MTVTKRLFDVVLALLLALLVLPVLALLLPWLWLAHGRPLFYLSERMKTPEQPFTLWKLRSMAPSDDNAGVSGGDKAARVTKPGLFLRKTRLDELPQLWNVLCGDLSFVGPRPPLREYVERFPALYGRVLRSRPGITGLATLVYHRHEERLLAGARDAAETDAIYVRACVPRKARLDLIYQEHRNLCFDLWLIARTAGRVLPKRRG
ncbi:sugar transferase [Shimia sp.]|uniref:sugar transferase n=1 Tax=Shimia sp. TaxID=1954381 RepID=UPI0035647F18